MPGIIIVLMGAIMSKKILLNTHIIIVSTQDYSHPPGRSIRYIIYIYINIYWSLSIGIREEVVYPVSPNPQHLLGPRTYRKNHHLTISAPDAFSPVLTHHPRDRGSASFNKRKVKVKELDWPNSSECGVTFANWTQWWIATDFANHPAGKTSS